MPVPDLFRIFSVAMLAAALFVSGCASDGANTTTDGDLPPEDPALGEMSPLDAEVYRLEAEGRYSAAANVLLNASVNALPADKDNYLIRAAELLARAGDPRRAWIALQALSPELDPTTEKRRRLIAGELYLADGRGLEVLNVLPHDPAGLSTDEYQKMLNLRGQAYFFSGAPLEGLRDLVLRESYIAEPEGRAENARLLWRNLISTQSENLDSSLGRARQDPVLSGWLRLARINQDRWIDASGFNDQVLRWRVAYPNHPANISLLPEIMAAHDSQTQYPEQITLMVPLTGRYASAGKAVRDGLFASWFASSETARLTKIKVVDTAANGTQSLEDYVRQLYASAANDGSALTIGPLQKEAIDALSVLQTRPIPVLALNNLDMQDRRWTRLVEMPDELQPIYQLGLAPELEAGLAARRASQDGRHRALVVVPRGSWGERVYKEFARSFVGQGGNVVGAEYYESRDSDFSTPLKRALHLGRSTARKSRLERTLGLSLEAEPRRRQDADMIFIGAFPRQARLLRPQLKFHRASKLPIYATSHVYSGVVDPGSDRDMDGIQFTDMPWLLESGARFSALKHDLQNSDSRAFKKSPRLYALGVDAFRLAPLVVHGAPPGTWYVAGATGMLSLEDNGTVRRDLQWAEFKSGKPSDIEQAAELPKARQGMKLESGLGKI
ncbi:MAG: outer membrane PBP1 activator LpoA protein [Gammaproteobacteria bacterium]|jgi:outer membrane PBP1 activator LpoA protein